VHFIIQMEEKHIKAAVTEGLEERFKLTKTLATSNLVAFDKHGRLHRYENVVEILKEFFGYRKEFYVKRKANQLSALQRDLDRMTNQARFVQMIIDGKLVVSKKKKADLVAELRRKDFKPFPKVQDASKAGETEAVVENENEEEENADANAYDYLLGVSLI
jgi:DNA topoisomerase-2